MYVIMCCSSYNIITGQAKLSLDIDHYYGQVKSENNEEKERERENIYVANVYE